MRAWVLPQENFKTALTLKVRVLSGNRQPVLEGNGSNPDIVCRDFLPKAFQICGEASVLHDRGLVGVEYGGLTQKSNQRHPGFFRLRRFLKAVPQFSQNSRADKHIGIFPDMGEGIETFSQVRHHNAGVKENADHFDGDSSVSGGSMESRRPDQMAFSMACPSDSSTPPKDPLNACRRFSRAWGFFRKNSSQMLIRSRGVNARPSSLAMSVSVTLVKVRQNHVFRNLPQSKKL